ncbi:hypothetical protein AB0D97_36710 [Streptomyces roseus]
MVWAPLLLGHGQGYEAVRHTHTRCESPAAVPRIRGFEDIVSALAHGRT